MECEYCHKHFNIKGSLLRHQQQTKSCIKIQEAKLKIKLTCTGCNDELSSKQKLFQHQQICDLYLALDTTKQKYFEQLIENQNIRIENQNIIIEELKLHIKELVSLKSKGGKITNTNTFNIYQNFTPITDEKLKQDSINFTKKDLELGGQGIGQYALKNTLKDNFVCTDISRFHSKYIDGDGDLVIDPYSHTITRRVCESLVEPAKRIYDEHNMPENDNFLNDDFLNVFIKLNDISTASKGFENDLTRDFTKTICSNNIKKV